MCKKETKEDRLLRESVERARSCGVPEEKILHNLKEGDAFFLCKNVKNNEK